MSDLNEVSYKLGQIDGKLDRVIQKLTEHDEKFNEGDDRISKLERGRAWVMGVGAAISSIFAVLWSFLLERS